MKRPALVILAAGRARRFGGVKPLAPIGPNHEAVIDLLASDAAQAGFGQIVLVLNRDSGPQIRAHVEEVWPADLEVAFALQERPLGTINAVLAARDVVDPSVGFSVVNADDLYGAEALSLAASELSKFPHNLLVGFRLANAIAGDEPVTRGVCEVTDGQLTGVTERRQVTASDGIFRSDDGLDPAELDPNSVVSMNLWGFAPEMWEIFATAMAQATDASEEAEVLLPEVVGRVVNGALDAAPALRRIDVIPTESRCIGVTHPGDLEVVRAELLELVAQGRRPQGLFETR
jgi:hypothetical protein